MSTARDRVVGSGSCPPCTAKVSGRYCLSSAIDDSSFLHINSLVPYPEQTLLGDAALRLSLGNPWFPPTLAPSGRCPGLPGFIGPVPPPLWIRVLHAVFPCHSRLKTCI